MSAFKAAMFATVGLGAAIAGIAVAQSQTKSSPLTRLEEGEVVMVSPKTGTIHKSSTKMREDGLAALGKGAKELSGNVLIFKRGGKLYMQDEANTEAAIRSQMFENE